MVFEVMQAFYPQMRKILTADCADLHRFFESENRMRPLRGRGRRGVDVYPGSAPPGYVMGMLRIPRICCTPEGVQRKTIYTREKTETHPHALRMRSLRMVEGICQAFSSQTSPT